MFAYPLAWLGLATDDGAVTALEYALIAGIIATTIIVGFNVLAGDVSAQFANIAAKL